ncbi:MAG: AAA family ATPase [Anaerolineaceae bacterium]|nr:AAA family ATPase [Anaerolineaceae bacterium]
MSIVKPDAKNKLAPPRKVYAWENEKTRVEERQKLRYRLQRTFTLPRLIIIILVAAMLLDASVMRGIIGFINQIATAIVQNFSVDFTNLTRTLLQLLIGITIAVGQFALIFWFLGNARTYTIWPGAASEGISFDDYRGQPELLEQARQIVKLLRGVRIFEESGGEPLNGLLLEGPPGTGKTWLAKAISTEANVPFFYIDASSLNSMFMGIAPMKVSNLYRKARNAAKDYGAAIIFIDEIDAIGSRSGVATNPREGDTDTRLPMLFGMGSNSGMVSTLLVEMDGFNAEHGGWAKRKAWFYKNILGSKLPKPRRRVLTIGATNRMLALDPALLRAGRFDKKIRVDAPDLEGRRDIFDYYLEHFKHDETVNSLILASETPYYTPADIKHLINEALRYAMFDGRDTVTINDVRQAQPEHEFGLRSPIKNMTAEDRYRLAAHEVGHALSVRLFMPSHRIARITIIRQGGAHGYVLHYPAIEDNDIINTYDSLMGRLRVSIGGRAGELEFVGEHSQTLGVGTGFGDGSDFGNIRYILTMMAEVGMFGPLGAHYSGELTEEMENTFRNVLEEVRLSFRLHKEMGEALIKLVLEKDEIFADEIEAFFDKYGLYTPKVDLDPYKKIETVTGGKSA